MKNQMMKLNAGREYRDMRMTVRSLENGGESMVADGYATTFNQPYLLYECKHFKILEQIDSHAFDECDMIDVIFQYDHTGRVYARTRNKTLTLQIDAIGLKVTADLSGTEAGKQLYQEIQGGYTDRMSFGFAVREDKRESVIDHDTGFETITRTITKISKLYDVSAVSIPANDTTSISARRSADGVIGIIKAERLERARKKLRLLMEVTQ